MADQVQIKLIGDDKAFLKTLLKLRDRFKEIKSASNKAQKVVKKGADKSKTSLNAQRNAARLLTNGFTRLARVAVASQKIMQTQIRRTSSLLRKQLALLRRAKVIAPGLGGARPGGRAQTAQGKPKRTPANDRAQFFGQARAQSRDAPAGTPIKDVNPEGQFTQRALAQQNTKSQTQAQTALRQSFRQTNEEIAKQQRAGSALAEQRKTTGARAVAGERKKAAAVKRSTTALTKQSQPLTLLVAKFALMAFAIQTVANIVNSTFGAILKQIDDFEVAAVGTAVAVTGISKSTKPIGEIFTNNLEAAKQAFESLDIVAAQFFSTGAELQLAFNTLAQRGVVVREEEFNILGKLTDQIKLLTGGQNTQIQIQQELRAILDGNVRTTTAFGKSLQARGVDVKQLSKEVRATGSLKVFEEFLTGLDAASGAIRRTLSSVTATFSSLFNILTRNIFRSTFDGAVDTITDINNLIIEQRDVIIQMGILIKNEIADAWNGILDILDLMSATFIRLIKNDLVAFVGAFALAGKLIKRGPFGAILGVSTALAGATGEAGTFGDSVSILFNLLAIGIDQLVKALDGVINVFKELGELITAFGAGGFSLTFQVKGLQRAETSLNDLGKDLNTVNRQIQFLGKIPERTVEQQERLSNALSRQLRIMREMKTAAARVDAARTNIEDSGESGREFLAGRTSNLTSDVRASVAGGLSTVAGLVDEAASSLLKNTKEEGADLLEDFAKLASKIKIPNRAQQTFEPVIQPREINKKRILEQFAQQDAKQDITRQNKLDEDTGRLDVAEATNKKEFDARLVKGREFFLAQQALRREDLANQEKDANARIAILRNRTDRELLIIKNTARQRAIEAQPAAVRTTKAAIELLEKQKKLTDEQVKSLEKLRAVDNSIKGLTKLTDKEESRRIVLLVTEQKTSAKIFKEILDLKVRGKQEDEKDLGILKEQARVGQQILDQRKRQIDEFGGQTNEQRITEINAEKKIAVDNFNATNADPEQRKTFAAQADQIAVQKAIKPQIEAVAAAIDATFQTLIDGLLEGSFEFRDLAQTISKDFIQSGLQGLITQIKNSVTKSLTDIFKAIGKGADDAAAGAQRAAQGLILAFGLLLAVLSRTGNEGDFEATGGGGGGGVDQSSVQTRGLIGGDTQIAIAEINNGLQEAMIPTNALLSQIERNTRSLADVGGLGDLDLQQLISDRVDAAFSQSLLAP